MSVELIRVDKKIHIEFLINKDNEKTFNIIDKIFRGNKTITNENKNIMPEKIHEQIDFRRGERYMAVSYNLSTNLSENVIIDIEFKKLQP